MVRNIWYFKMNFLELLSPFLHIELVTSCPELSRHMEQLSTIPFSILAIFKGFQLETYKHYLSGKWVSKSNKRSYCGFSSLFKNFILYFSPSKTLRLVEVVVLYLNLQCSCTCVLYWACLFCSGITLNISFPCELLYLRSFQSYHLVASYSRSVFTH